MFPVKTIMTKDVVTVNADTPIFDAILLLKDHEISGVPVVDEEMNLVGILSEKDALGILLEDTMRYNETVADYMSQNVVSFSEEDSAIDVCRFFLSNPIRRVPIVENGKLVGIVSRRDIISLILEVKNKMSSNRLS